MTNRTINLKEAADIVRYECGAWTGLAETIIRRFKKLSTVDAVPVRHGRWKEDPSGYGFWICSACGFVSEASAANILYKFCPNCGAVMGGE